MNFSSRLRDLRRSRRLTQQQFADRVGLTVGQVSKYENRLQPSIAAIVRIAHGLEIDACELAEPVIASAAANSPMCSQVVG